MGNETPADFTAFQLQRFIAPIVPRAMGITAVVIAATWIVSWQIGNPHLGKLALLHCGAGIILLACAVLCHYAASRAMPVVVSVTGIAFVGVLSTTLCLVSYNNHTGLLQSLPYCMVAATIGGFFWPRAWSLLGGTVACMVPPYILMTTLYDGTLHIRVIYSQLLFFTLAIACAFWFLMNRVNRRTYHLLREVEAQSRLDSLTGLYNRRAWYERAYAAHTAEDRADTPVVLLYIDIDYFKSVNDRLGHVAGDEVLQRVANIVEAAAGPEAIVARFGGEEFVVYLPATDLPAAIARAERMQAALQTTSDWRCPVTISVGISAATVGEPLDDMIRRADQALLRAKDEGRDRFVVAEQPSASTRPAAHLWKHAGSPVPATAESLLSAFSSQQRERRTQTDRDRRFSI
jgi:diguanylate cyclase (GGDEF)-like protein